MAKRDGELEPSTSKLLELSVFEVNPPFNLILLSLTCCQGKFDVTEFVGSMSEQLIAKSKADTGRE